MSRVAKKLETYAEDYISYECYVSATGHSNIAFDCESVLVIFLKAMGLLEKIESGCISICFTLDFAEVRSITKMGVFSCWSQYN